MLDELVVDNDSSRCHTLDRVDELTCTRRALDAQRAVKIVFTASFDCTYFYPWNFMGLAAITSSSGSLAGMTGWLHFGDVTYTGVLH